MHDAAPNTAAYDPDVFPKNVHELLKAADSGQMALSELADKKSSTLMGATFVVFSLSIGAVSSGKASIPLLLLAGFSFLATVLSVITVRPGPVRRSKRVPEAANLLYFGSFTNMSREDYVEQVMRTLPSQGAVYRHMAKSIYDHGFVLRKEKYRWLYWSYTLFLSGMIATAMAVIGKVLLRHL